MKSSRSTTQAPSSPATRPTFPIRTAPPRKPVYVPEPALPGPDSRRCVGRFTRSRATPGSARTATVVRAALPQPHSRRPEPQGHGAYLPLLAASPRLRTARRPAPGATATPVDTLMNETRPYGRTQASRVEQGNPVASPPVRTHAEPEGQHRRRARPRHCHRKAPATGACLPALGTDQQSAAHRQRPGARRQRPAASGARRQRPAASGARRQRPAARRQRPVGSGQQPAASSQQPAASSQQPAASGQRPAASG